MSTIIKNIGLSILTYLTKILSGSVVFLILAKTLSINDFGLLSFGISLCGILTVFSEFGFSLMAQRDIPQNKFNLNNYVYNVFLQKFLFCSLTLLLGVVYSCYFYDKDNTVIGIIFTINAILTSLIMFLLAVFRSKNYFIQETNSSLYYLFAVLVLLIIYFLFEINIIELSIGLLIARLVQVFFLSYSYLNNYGTSNFYGRTLIHLVFST